MLRTPETETEYCRLKDGECCKQFMEWASGLTGQDRIVAWGAWVNSWYSCEQSRKEGGTMITEEVVLEWFGLCKEATAKRGMKPHHWEGTESVIKAFMPTGHPKPILSNLAPNCSLDGLPYVVSDRLRLVDVEGNTISEHQQPKSIGGTMIGRTVRLFNIDEICIGLRVGDEGRIVEVKTGKCPTCGSEGYPYLYMVERGDGVRSWCVPDHVKVLET